MKKFACAATTLGALALCLLAAVGACRRADHRSFHQLDRPRTRILWKFPTTEWVIALASGRNGVVCGAWTGNKISVLSPDGRLVRELATDAAGMPGLAVGTDDTIYVLREGDANTDNVYAFGPDAALRWKSRTWTSHRALALGPDGSVYVGSIDFVLLLDPRNGTAERKLDPQTNVRALAVGRDRSLYVGSGNEVEAISAEGKLGWKFVAPGILIALATGRDGAIYVTYAACRNCKPRATESQVYALNPRNGVARWSFGAVGTLFALAEGSNGTVYAGSYDSHIYGLDPKTGALRWKFGTGSGGWGSSPVHALAVANNGVIYAGAGSSVEAIKPEE